MIPPPELLAEFMVGLGAALFGANLLVLVRSRRPPGRDRPRRPALTSMTRVYTSMTVGALVALWGLAALLRQR